MSQQMPSNPDGKKMIARITVVGLRFTYPTHISFLTIIVNSLSIRYQSTGRVGAAQLADSVVLPEAGISAAQSGKALPDPQHVFLSPAML
jgi:hypothetical protein